MSYDNRLKFTEEALNFIIDQEARKTVGIILKRHEFITDKEILKKETKETLYEAFRNLRDMIRVSGKESIHLVNTDEK